MATEIVRDECNQIIKLTAQEAADIIGLLAAQLADTPLVGNQAGACPTIKIVEDGRIKYALSLIIERPRHV